MADIGLRNMQLGVRPNNFGHILENVVYLELRRRGWQIFVGRIGQQEIDFVCQQGGTTEYYQVALTVREEGTLQRELAPLKSVKDNYSKYLLTLDNDPDSSYGASKNATSSTGCLANNSEAFPLAETLPHVTTPHSMSTGGPQWQYFSTDKQHPRY